MTKEINTRRITGGRLQKLVPTAKLPNALGLRRFSADDLALLRKRLSEPVECVFHPTFKRARAEGDILELVPETPEHVRTDLSAESDLDSDFGLFSNMRTFVLSPDEEMRLFLAFNYCRYRVMRILRQYRGKRLLVSAARELLHWERASQGLRSEIIRLNISLVLAMARRAKINGVEMADLVSEGNFALVRCVDKFDCTRGFKFSTYACRAILSAFTRVATKGARYRGQFPATFDESLEKSDFVERQREQIEVDCVDSLRDILSSNLADLSSVEQQVLAARFALSRSIVDVSHLPSRGKTLEEVGELLGVSKERVRQIQNKALSKLRDIIEDHAFAIPVATE